MDQLDALFTVKTENSDECSPASTSDDLKTLVDLPSLVDSSTPDPKRKCYGMELKLEAVAYAEQFGKAAAARHFKVDRRQIQRWTQQKGEIQTQMNCATYGGANKRLKGGGRQVKNEEFEKTLFEWIRGRYEQNLPVSRIIIQQQAQLISTDETFKCSNGWLERFLKRHCLSNNRRTVTLDEEALHTSERQATAKTTASAADGTGGSEEPMDYQKTLMDFLSQILNSTS